MSDKKDKGSQQINLESSFVDKINQVKNSFFFFIFGGQKEEDSNRNIMLDRVYQYWVTDVLEKSLYNQVMITLGIEKQHNQTRLNSARIWTQQKTNELLPKDTKLIEVFDENKNNLLILGEAGSGKTTELINLAKNLIQRAKEDEDLPIPVIVNLSSYHKKQSLEKWLINELKTFYDIPKNIIKYWLANDQLLLLLDGLDEVKQELRSQCVSHINSFCENTIHSVVVCSRIDDYKSLDTKLNFSTQVVLQPLNMEQIQDYLNHVDETNQFQALREFINTDREFQELVNTPFMLNVAVLAYQDKKTEDVKKLDTITEHRNYILDEYIIRTLQIPNEYTNKQNLRWLHNLSSIMYKNSLSVFSFLDLGSKVLIKNVHQYVYNMVSAFLLYLVFVYIFFPTIKFDGIDTNNILNIIIIMIPMLFIILINNSVKLKTINNLSFHSIFLGIIQFFIMCILFFCSLLVIVNYTTEPFNWLLGLMVTFGSILSLIICTSLILLALLIMVIFTPGILLDTDLLFLTSIMLIFLLLSRYVIPRMIKFSKQTRKNFRYILPLKYFFLFGFFGGFVYSLTYAFNGKTTHISSMSTIKTHIEALIVTFAILLSILWSCYLLIVSSSVNMPLFISSFKEPFIIVFIIYIIDLIKYVVLKTVIKIFNIFPFDIENFLNYATKNIILRQVGSGYIFIHRLLLEHFANMTDTDIERLSQEIDRQKLIK